MPLHPELTATTHAVTCQIVTAPELSAQVLADLNDKSSTALDRGRTLSFGAPTIAVAATSLAAAEPRTIKLPLKVYGNEGSAQRTLMGVARTLMSTSPRWLLWRQSPHADPTWFRLLPRSTGGELDLTMVPMEDARVWRWDLELQAEAFSYGARVTETIPLTYRKWDGTTDTTNISGKLSTVKGDAPTRARIDLYPTNGSMASWAPHLSVAGVPAGAWTTGPQVFEVESLSGLTLGAGYTQEQIAFGGALPAGSPNAIKCPAASNTGYAGGKAFRGTAAGVLPGTYKVMLRCITYSAGAVAPSFKARVVMNTTVALGDWGTWRKPAATPGNQGGFASMLNAGIIQIPAGMDPEGFDASAFYPPEIQVDHRGDGGTQDTWVDQMVLIPVKLTAGTATTTHIGMPTDEGPASLTKLRVDDLVDRVGIIFPLANNTWRTATPPRVLGGFPVLTPGLDNWITMLPNTGTGGQSDSVGPDTYTLDVSYHPRYLHLAGS